MKTKLTLLLLTLFLGFTTHLKAQNIFTIAGNGSISLPVNGALATECSLDTPYYLAIDEKRNFYFCIYGNLIYKISSEGRIYHIAGNGVVGFSGDGGPATDASFGEFPISIAADKGGNVYVADQYNGRVRKIDTLGIITTIAGDGSWGAGGDGGPATDADIFPFYVKTDGSGNLYISEYDNGVIRKVNTSGIISTIIGNGIGGYAGDGGPATAATINGPTEMAIDSSGNFYFIDQFYSIIRKISTSGIITTIAGNDTSGYTGDGGPATTAEIYPFDLAVTSKGVVYFTNIATRVRKIDTNGIISTVAGNNTEGFSGDGGPASAAELNGPGGIVLDTLDNIYLTDGSRIREICFCVINSVPILNEIKAISTYPNPNNGEFTISLPYANSPAIITITDILGKVITTKHIPFRDNINETFDLTNLPPATYLIRVEAGGSIYRDKVVINR